jgi:hypothetical protein
VTIQIDRRGWRLQVARYSGNSARPGRDVAVTAYNLQVEINVNYHLFTGVLSAN